MVPGTTGLDWLFVLTMATVGQLTLIDAADCTGDPGVESAMAVLFRVPQSVLSVTAVKVTRAVELAFVVTPNVPKAHVSVPLAIEQLELFSDQVKPLGSVSDKVTLSASPGPEFHTTMSNRAV